MEKNYRFVGLAMEINVRDQQQEPHIIRKFSHGAGFTDEQAVAVLSWKNNTGVSRCSDPITGKYADGNGLPCTRFLHCFR